MHFKFVFKVQCKLTKLNFGFLCQIRSNVPRFYTISENSQTGRADRTYAQNRMKSVKVLTNEYGVAVQGSVGCLKYIKT